METLALWVMLLRCEERGVKWRKQVTEWQERCWMTGEMLEKCTWVLTEPQAKWGLWRSQVLTTLEFVGFLSIGGGRHADVHHIVARRFIMGRSVCNLLLRYNAVDLCKDQKGLKNRHVLFSGKSYPWHRRQSNMDPAYLLSHHTICRIFV